MPSIGTGTQSKAVIGLISVLPVMVLFLILPKEFVAGFTARAVKG